MRMFVAVALGDDARAAYEPLYLRARRLYPDWRWVAPENLHITLRFLGECGPELIEPLGREVDAEVAGGAPFSFTIGAPGQFSSGRGGAARVLWFGVAQGAGALEGLAGRVERAARRARLPREKRPWRAHLTVARHRRRAPAELTPTAWQTLGCECGLAGLTVKVENVALLESTLRPEGPLYSVVWKVHLGGGVEK